MPPRPVRKQASKSFLSRIKDHPVVVAFGAIGAVAGALASIPKAWEFVSDVFDVPNCIFYSDKYEYVEGYFKKDGARWVEYKKNSNAPYAEFSEVKRGKKSILINNMTPRQHQEGQPELGVMLISLPPCGGTARWTLQNPQNWEDLYQVWKGIVN